MSVTSITATTSRRTVCQLLHQERKSRSLSSARPRLLLGVQSHENNTHQLQKCIRPSIQKCMDSARSSSLINQRNCGSSFRTASVAQSCRRSLSTSRNSETSRASSSETKWALKEWLPSVPRSIDISGMYRTLESLHVDLPKMLPDYRQILEQLKQSVSSRSSSLKVANSTKSEENQILLDKKSVSRLIDLKQDALKRSSHSIISSDSTHNDVPNDIKHIDSELQGEKVEQISSNVQCSPKQESIPLQVRLAAIRSKAGHTQRQEHDFSEAINSMYQSVESFNTSTSNKELNEKLVTSKPADGSKYSSVRRVLIETAKMLSQSEATLSKETQAKNASKRCNTSTLLQNSSSNSQANDNSTEQFNNLENRFSSTVSTSDMVQSNGNTKPELLKTTEYPFVSFAENSAETSAETFQSEINDVMKSGKKQFAKTTLDDHYVYFSEKSATAADEVTGKQIHNDDVSNQSNNASDAGTDDRRKLSIESLKSQALAVATSAYTSTSGLVRQVKDYMPTVDTASIGSYLSGKSNADTNSALTKSPDASTATSKGTTKKVAASASKSVPMMKRPVVSRAAVDRRTRALVLSLREARTPISQIARVEELSRHLTDYPESGSIAVRNKAVPCLLRLRSSTLTKDSQLSAAAREVLSLLGYVDPVAGRGIRILSLDGGGTRGLIAIELMKRLEAATRCPIHEMFDYICGVSTGALIAVMTGVFRVPLEETELLYKQFSTQMFARNRLLGAGKLFMSHAYYDTDIWERILQDNIGFKSFLETSRDDKCPKISAVSALINVHTAENFLFRNYGYLPTGPRSHYAGAVEHRLWQGIRASSAAPGYFEEFDLGNFVHQDGGLLTNNPTAIAIHESQLLWPGTGLQCVVSLGTGKYAPARGGMDPQPVSKSSLKSKAVKIVQSATDTEAVHTVLLDLLKPSTYFRFNPYMSEDFQLDEIREEKWDQMKFDTEMYCRKNQLQIELVAQRLLQPKPLHRKAADWCKLKWNMIG